MMAELAPPGFDYMVQPPLLLERVTYGPNVYQFFGLFGLCNRTSSMIGPNVVQAIVDRTGNNWMGFPFLLGLCTTSSLIIWFWVDVPRGREDARTWALQHREAMDVPASDGRVLT
jgi:hypothetical protein